MAGRQVGLRRVEKVARPLAAADKRGKAVLAARKAGVGPVVKEDGPAILAYERVYVPLDKVKLKDQARKAELERAVVADFCPLVASFA